MPYQDPKPAKEADLADTGESQPKKKKVARKAKSPFWVHFTHYSDYETGDVAMAYVRADKALQRLLWSLDSRGFCLLRTEETLNDLSSGEKVAFVRLAHEDLEKVYPGTPKFLEIKPDFSVVAVTTG